MNSIKVKVKSVISKDSLHIVEFSFHDEPLYMMSLELHSPLYKEDELFLGIKPTHIALAKKFDVDLSFLNQMKVSIVSIEVGELVCVVKGAINGIILESIISSKAYHRMNFQVGDSLIMLLPASELFILDTFTG